MQVARTHARVRMYAPSDGFKQGSGDVRESHSESAWNKISERMQRQKKIIMIEHLTEFVLDLSSFVIAYRVTLDIL